MEIKDSIAIVTGGSEGIGRGIAEALIAKGSKVTITGRREHVLKSAADEMGADFIAGDVGNEQDAVRTVEAVVDKHSRLDILVNNAGIVHDPGVVRHFLEMPAATWHRLMAVHLNGLFYCSQRAARIMARQRAGCIINMSSGGATRAHRQMVAYDTTKGGIEAATRAMALDLAPWQIRVNVLVPGAIAVEERAPVGKESAVQPADVIPLARLGTPEDVAGAALFLASDDAAYVTGHALFVDGGLTAQLRTPGVDARPDPELLQRF